MEALSVSYVNEKKRGSTMQHLFNVYSGHFHLNPLEMESGCRSGPDPQQSPHNHHRNLETVNFLPIFNIRSITAVNFS